MKKHTALLLVTSFFLCLPLSSFSQTQEIFISNGMKIKPGAYFEYFAREVAWDESQNTSEIKSTIFAFILELEIIKGLSISGMAGYSLTNYDSLVFRQLPFSVDFDTGSIGGYALGAEVRTSLFHIDSFEFGLLGQFIYQSGKEESWDIPDLNVTGTVTSRPTWRRVTAGPFFKYTGIESISPYLSVCYNKLEGKFEMKQKVQILEGTEEKEMKSKGLIDISLGSILTLSDYFFLKGEVHILPYSDGMDLGIVATAAFSF